MCLVRAVPLPHAHGVVPLAPHAGMWIWTVGFPFTKSS
jgi:hypothetical protein